GRADEDAAAQHRRLVHERIVLDLGVVADRHAGANVGAAAHDAVFTKHGVLADLCQVPHLGAVAEHGLLGNVGAGGNVTHAATPGGCGRPLGLADDAVGDAGPLPCRAYPASVDKRGDARQVRRTQLAVLGVVGLHHGGVHGLAQVVGGEAQLCQFFVRVHGVVHQGGAAAAGDGLNGVEHAGEGGFLHPAAVGGAKHDDACPGEVAMGAFQEADGVVGHVGVGGAGGPHHGGV